MTIEQIKIIAAEEQSFPRLFANATELEFATLFHNTENRDSHDSNHAVLYPERIADLGTALDEIRDFYLSKELEPRIYLPFIENWSNEHAEIFSSHGWKLNIFEDYHIMLLSEAHRIEVPQRLRIRRLTEWDERLATDIFLPDDDEYVIGVTKRSLQNRDTYLFIGELNREFAVMLQLHTSERGCTRFDDIKTATKQRRNGYAREIMRYVTDFCRTNAFPLCFQWPAHETSERMSFDTGFRFAFTLPSGSATFEEG